MNENDKQIFQVPAVIISDKSMAHGSRRFTLETQENVPPELLNRLITLEGKVGWFSFAVKQIEAVDMLNLPEIDNSKYDKGKTPASRLRSVIYLVHKAKGGKEKDFPSYYDKAMESLIVQVKGMLE